MHCIFLIFEHKGIGLCACGRGEGGGGGLLNRIFGEVESTIGGNIPEKTENRLGTCISVTEIGSTWVE